MSHIFTIGESLLDIIFREGKFVAANAGGAMLNTAVSLGRAGARVNMVSELSDDNAGRMILSFLGENNVDTGSVRIYPSGKTPIALAMLDRQGDAKYNFYKDYPRERNLPRLPSISKKDIVLFGSLYSLSAEIRNDVVRLVANARSSGALTIYDPNIRANHAKEVPALFQDILENFAMAEIVRASDEDLYNIFGTTDEQLWIGEVLRSAPVLIITRASQGVDLYTRTFSAHYPSSPVNVVSTIGAGDSFNAGMIYGLSRLGQGQVPDEKAWQDVIAIATAFASDCCSHSDNYISLKFSATLSR